MEEDVKSRNIPYAFIALIIAIIVAILAVFFLAKPLFADNAKKQKTIENRRANLSVLKDKEAKLKNLSGKEEEIKEDARKVLAAMPEFSDKARLFVQFEGLASKSNLYLKSVSEGTATSPTTSTQTTTLAVPGVSEISYNLSLSGSYENFKNFLINAQNALRILKINKIDIKPSGGSNNLDISLNLSAFYNQGTSE